MIPALIVTLALCLPPDLPDPATLATLQTDSGFIARPGHQPEPITLTRYGYFDGTSAYNVFTVWGLGAVVDDHPDDVADTNYLIDPGMVTDRVPIELQPEPRSTCHWRRRLDKTL